MSVFAVIGDFDASSEAMQNAVKRAYPEKHVQVGEKSFFVDAPKGMTTAQVSDGLGIEKGSKMSGVVVVRLSGTYWGVAKSDLWEWLKSAMERDDG